MASVAGPVYEHWGFNLFNAHLSDPAVREALALAMDKTEVMAGLYTPLFGDLLPETGLGNTYWLSNQPTYEDHAGEAGYGVGDVDGEGVVAAHPDEVGLPGVRLPVHPDLEHPIGETGVVEQGDGRVPSPEQGAEGGVERMLGRADVHQVVAAGMQLGEHHHHQDGKEQEGVDRHPVGAERPVDPTGTGEVGHSNLVPLPWATIRFVIRV